MPVEQIFFFCAVPALLGALLISRVRAPQPREATVKGEALVD